LTVTGTVTEALPNGTLIVAVPPPTATTEYTPAVGPVTVATLAFEVVATNVAFASVNVCAFAGPSKLNVSDAGAAASVFEYSAKTYVVFAVNVRAPDGAPNATDVPLANDGPSEASSYALSTEGSKKPM